MKDSKTYRRRLDDRELDSELWERTWDRHRQERTTEAVALWAAAFITVGAAAAVVWFFQWFTGVL